MNCIVCAIAKNENAYIYEWAIHHLHIGFTHLHIYDNNDIDGERIEDVFRGTDIEKDVTIHDVRGMKCMQLKVYQECYDKEDFDWCAFIDIDEFITFTNPQMTITGFLKDKQQFEAVHLNWLCYGDNNQLKSDGRDVTKRFPSPIEPLDINVQYHSIPENDHIKSIIRKGLNVNWSKENLIIRDAQPHTPFGIKAICNELGETVENIPWHAMSHRHAYVAHYITKTITEYELKVSRRSADSNSYYHSYSRFFQYNKLTFMKLKTLKSTNPSVNLIAILLDTFMWWNVRHHTCIARMSKKYKRLFKQESLWQIEKYM